MPDKSLAGSSFPCCDRRHFNTQTHKNTHTHAGVKFLFLVSFCWSSLLQSHRSDRLHDKHLQFRSMFFSHWRVIHFCNSYFIILKVFRQIYSLSSKLIDPVNTLRTLNTPSSPKIVNSISSYLISSFLIVKSTFFNSISIILKFLVIEDSS